MQENNKGLKLLVIFVSIFILVAVGWLIFNYFNRLGKVKISLTVLPEDSVVTLNNTPTHPGSFYLSPGHYVFVAKRENFGTVEKTINISATSSPFSVTLLPTPDTAEALLYLTEHPEVQQKREAAGGVEFENNVTALAKKYPIVTKLPTYNSHYRIDYSVNEKQAISFSVTLYAILNNPNQYQQYQQQLKQDKTEALKFLKDNGIDPALNTVTFTPDV